MPAFLSALPSGKVWAGHFVFVAVCGVVTAFAIQGLRLANAKADLTRTAAAEQLARGALIETNETLQLLQQQHAEDLAALERRSAAAEAARLHFQTLTREVIDAQDDSEAGPALLLSRERLRQSFRAYRSNQVR